MDYKYKISQRLEKINESLSSIIAKKLLESEHNGICPCCGENKTSIKMRRQNTMYCDEDSNYVECCIECFNEIQEHWKEEWQEYYSTIRG